MRHWILAFTLLLPLGLFAAEEPSAPGLPPTSKWIHQSEAGIILAAGNTETQTFSLNQKTDYEWGNNALRSSGRYLMGKNQGVENARNWLVSLKYERLLSDQISAYTAYALDSNIYANLDLRHAIDLGGRYTFFKTEKSSLYTELGYRLTAESQLNPTNKLTSHFGRLYIAGAEQLTETLSSAAYIEYLPNLTRSSDWQLNAEPSFSVILNKVLSLKLAYLLQYRNTPAGTGKKQLDSLYTTSLVAKF